MCEELPTPPEQGQSTRQQERTNDQMHGLWTDVDQNLGILPSGPPVHDVRSYSRFAMDDEDEDDVDDEEDPDLDHSTDGMSDMWSNDGTSTPGRGTRSNILGVHRIPSFEDRWDPPERRNPLPVRNELSSGTTLPAVILRPEYDYRLDESAYWDEVADSDGGWESDAQGVVLSWETPELDDQSGLHSGVMDIKATGGVQDNVQNDEHHARHDDQSDKRIVIRALTTYIYRRVVDGADVAGDVRHSGLDGTGAGSIEQLPRDETVSHRGSTPVNPKDHRGTVPGVIPHDRKSDIGDRQADASVEHSRTKTSKRGPIPLKKGFTVQVGNNAKTVRNARHLFHGGGGHTGNCVTHAARTLGFVTVVYEPGESVKENKQLRRHAIDKGSRTIGRHVGSMYLDHNGR